MQTLEQKDNSTTANPARPQATVVRPGSASPTIGGVITELGVTLTFKAVSADTGGQFSLLEYDAPPRFAGVPAHWHKRMTETFYILQGRLSVQFEHETVDLTAGSFLLMPPGVVHAWHNPDDTPTKFLVHTSPGGFEDYMQELIASVKAEPIWPLVDRSRYVALGQKHDTFPPPAEV